MIDPIWKRAVLALSVAASLIAAAPALAGGGVGVTFGFGGYPHPHYGRHHHYRPPTFFGPPPVYYVRPPVYLPPPPVYYAPPVYGEPIPFQAQPQIQRGICREYQSTAVVNGAVVPTYGTACQQPDGTWRLIN
jgi:hypothetical protein